MSRRWRSQPRRRGRGRAPRARGWEDGHGDAAAAGGIDAARLSSDRAGRRTPSRPWSAVGGRLGLEVLTGDDWAVVAGSRAPAAARWPGPGSCRRAAARARAPGRPGAAGRAPAASGRRPAGRSRSTGRDRRHPQRHPRQLQRRRPLRRRVDAALAQRRASCSTDGAAHARRRAASPPGPGAPSRCPRTRSSRRVMPVVEALARALPAIAAVGGHGEGRGGARGARRGRGRRQRRLRAPARPRHGAAWWPQAGAGSS